MVLSGMSNMEQLKANIETYKEDKPLNDEEMKTLLGIADQMLGRKTLPCTACHYCVSHCPQELDIPTLLNLYNEHCFTGGGFIAPMALSSYPDDKKPGACIGCRSCEAGLSAADQNIRGNGGFRRKTCNVRKERIMNIQRVENMAGGKGHVIIKHILVIRRCTGTAGCMRK